MLRLSNFGGRSHDLKGASCRKKRAHYGGRRLGILRCRLLDMGLIPNTRVMVQKIAPMGDPMEIRLRSYELTLRMDGAAQIEMLPEVGA